MISSSLIHPPTHQRRLPQQPPQVSSFTWPRDSGKAPKHLVQIFPVGISTRYGGELVESAGFFSSFWKAGWGFWGVSSTGGKGKTMLDKLISIRNTQDRHDVFVVVNTTMDTAQAVDLLLSVFDYERGEALASALVAEIKRRQALEIERPERVKAARRKMTNV